MILSSPFEAFNGFEERNGLPRDFIRTINATNPDTNAWARFERSEVTFDEFCDLFEAECRERGTRSRPGSSCRCSPARSARRWSRRCVAAASGS